MKLFSFIKKEEKEPEKKEPEKPQLSREQKMVKENAIRLHKIKITNLNTELEELSTKLELIESDFDISQSKREKESDTIIRRISLLKYEIETREGLVKWLS